MMRGVGIYLASAILLTIGACAQLPQFPHERFIESAMSPGTSAKLDRAIAPIEARHEGGSAFRLVVDGYEAFALRTLSAAYAERSIDVQTYIWHPDITGAHLADSLLAAADRGVRVRILIDDMDAREKHYAFSAISAHPNISVRFFNPFETRVGTFAKITEMLTSFDRANRRMHNKTWIVDNRVAFVGGRNIGDEYFGASDAVNFVDLGVTMIGPVVRDASASFDRYWNSSIVYPAEWLAPQDVNGEALVALRDKVRRLLLSDKSSRYADVLQDDPLVERIVVGEWRMHWTDDYSFISDDPLKAFQGSAVRISDIYARLLEQGRRAQQKVWILSPYFVPGEKGAEALEELARRGVDVRVITNSLASNDVVAVHSGYRKYRKRLIAAGVKIWELKPAAMKRPRASLFGSSGASLHAKALVFDGRNVFVGSYNLDPRSNALNTEQGVMMDNRPVAEQLDLVFMVQSDSEHAWRVELRGDELYWSDGKVEHASEPGAGMSRRALARIIGWLPVESHL